MKLREEIAARLRSNVVREFRNPELIRLYARIMWGTSHPDSVVGVTDPDMCAIVDDFFKRAATAIEKMEIT